MSVLIGGPQVNMLEQVSSDGHQMSLAEVRAGGVHHGLWSDGDPHEHGTDRHD